MAVFAPLALLEGNVGRLFREFALALAASIGCSGLIALTLSPVLSVWMLNAHEKPNRFLAVIDRGVRAMSLRYERALGVLTAQRLLAAMVMVVVALASALLFVVIPKEFTPREDRGDFTVNVVAPEGASFGYTEAVMREAEVPLLARLGQGEVERVLYRMPGFGGGDQINSGSLAVTLAPWTDRTRTAQEISTDVAQAFDGITSARVFITQRSGFGSRGGLPLQVAIGGSSYEELAEWRDRIFTRVQRENPNLQRLDSDYRETKPQIELDINLERAGDLNVSVLTIAQAIETFFGERRVTRYQDRGEEYDVILQAPVEDRREPSALANVYVRSQGGDLIPLSNLVSYRESASAAAYNRVDRLRAITLSAALAPGYTLGAGLEYLEQVIREESQGKARITYRGESREFKESSSALYLTFVMALIVVYLVLAAQFESFVHPLVILTTVPLAVFGALAALWGLGMTLNVYSQIGIVMLVGLAAKNGILIVEFANQRRDLGVPFAQALREAATIRLRPILMTSIATIAGAVPLIFAVGAGYEARRILGTVILFGVAFSAVFTLFIVPAFYNLLCRNTGSPDRHNRRLQQQATDAGEPQPTVHTEPER